MSTLHNGLKQRCWQTHALGLPHAARPAWVDFATALTRPPALSAPRTLLSAAPAPAPAQLSTGQVKDLDGQGPRHTAPLYPIRHFQKPQSSSLPSCKFNRPPRWLVRCMARILLARRFSSLFSLAQKYRRFFSLRMKITDYGRRE